MNTVNKSIFSKLTFFKFLRTMLYVKCGRSIDSLLNFQYFFEMRKQIKYFGLLESNKTRLKYLRLSEVVKWYPD